jgi:cell division protein FtsN
MAAKNIKNFELKLGRTGIIVIIVGMAALICSVFLLGVEIGKNIDTYPGKISSLPAKIFALISKPSNINPPQNLPGEEKEDIDLTFYQTLTGKEEVKKQKQDIDEKRAVEVSPLIVAAEKTGEKKNPIDEIAVSANIIDEAVSSEKVINEKYTIHAASFKEKEKAYLINKEITTLGFNPKIIPIEVKNKGTFYRVIVPGFENKAAAQTAAERISAKTGLNCIINKVEIYEEKQQ